MDNNPTRNNVAVKPEPLPEATNSGLYLGVLPTPNHRDGEVVSIGPDCEMVKVGDKILFMPRRGVSDEGLYVINEEDDILYIYDKEEA